MPDSPADRTPRALTQPPADPMAVGWRSFVWQCPLFLLAWFAALELLMRAFLMSPNTVLSDPLLGWRWSPNSSFLVYTTDAGYRRVRVNELGYNDEPVSPKSGRQRFIVLGDSFVEAFQVPRHENFVGLLQAELPQMQFINAGQAGLDPALELAVLERLEPSLRPDGVIMLVSDGDRGDLLAGSARIKACPGSHDVCGYRIDNPPEGRLKLLLKRAMDHSALLTFVLRKYKDQLDKLTALLAARGPTGEPDPPGEWRRPSPDEILPLLRFIFGRMSNHRPVVVVFLPTLEFGPDRKVTTVTPSGDFVAQVSTAAHEAGALFVDAGKVLRASYATSGAPPVGFNFEVVGSGHLNARGHRAIADVLKNALAELDISVAK